MSFCPSPGLEQAGGHATTHPHKRRGSQASTPRIHPPTPSPPASTLQLAPHSQPPGPGTERNDGPRPPAGQGEALTTINLG